MTLAATTAIAAAHGIVRTRGDADHAPAWGVVCSGCGCQESFGWPISMPPMIMAKKLRMRGWQLSERAPPVCQECQRKERAVAKTRIGPDPKIARKIYAALDEHFNEEKRLYRSGWSDERIAREIDTSIDVVVRIRRDAYGELAELPEVQALRDDVELFKMQVSEDVAKLLRDANQRAAELLARLETLPGIHKKAAG